MIFVDVITVAFQANEIIRAETNLIIKRKFLIYRTSIQEIKCDFHLPASLSVFSLSSRSTCFFSVGNRIVTFGNLAPACHNV